MCNTRLTSEIQEEHESPQISTGNCPAELKRLEASHYRHPLKPNVSCRSDTQVVTLTKSELPRVHLMQLKSDQGPTSTQNNDNKTTNCTGADIDKAISALPTTTIESQITKGTTAKRCVAISEEQHHQHDLTSQHNGLDDTILHQQQNDEHQTGRALSPMTLSKSAVDNLRGSNNSEIVMGGSRTAHSYYNRGLSRSKSQYPQQCMTIFEEQHHHRDQISNIHGFQLEDTRLQKQQDTVNQQDRALLSMELSKPALD